jgi:PAS domain S-box-containing protein
VNSPSRNQPTPARRPIVLRQTGALPMAGTENGESALVEPAPTESVDPTTLQAENAKLRNSIAQWSKAESEWSQQRRLFQLMMDNVSDMIVLLDTQGHRSWNNAAYSHNLGYEPDEIGGTYALQEVHPDDKARATESLNHSLEKGTTEQCDYRVQQKGGAWVHFQTETIPVIDTNGKVESVLLLAHNATENAALSEALTLASTKATAAGLVHGMARDFDQVLTNVVGNLTIAKNLNGPHNAIAVRLNEIERSLQRARDLIEQMFSITSEQAPVRIRTALEPAVQTAVTDVLRGTMVRAEYLFPRNLNEIEIEEEAFAHAIRNVVTNSVQAMSNGVVRFTAENLPATMFNQRRDLPLKVGNYVCLHIQDQGHGITEKALSRVFEPYFTTRQGSQGLGLTTALNSVQRMGGSIVIDSQPGVGTTVSIYLPAAVDSPDSDGAPTRTGTVALPGSNTPGGSRMSGAIPRMTGSIPRVSGTGALIKPTQRRRILLMDDEQMILDIVSRMLGHLGYDVSTCTDGSQAIAAFAKAKTQGEPFDVVMMDLVIPNGVGGQDAVHTIKKIDPTARVIASSGHLEHPVMQDHKNFGFNAVLEKPYKLEKLQQVIEAVVSG